MFTKQHYEKIAKSAKNSNSQTKEQFILELVELFRADNAKFNPEKFFSKIGNSLRSESAYLKLANLIETILNNINLNYFALSFS